MAPSGSPSGWTPKPNPHKADTTMHQPVKNAVAALAAARRNHQAAPSAQAEIGSAEAAYAVQDGVALAMGWFAGRDVPRHWKSGGANRTAEMAHAPLPPQGVWASPADARQWPFFHRGIEGEIALRLGQDVTPAQAATLDGAQACRLVDAMCVAIEVVDFRWAEAGAAPPWHKMADNLSHGALVLGEWVPFQPPDWSRQRCVATIGSQPATEHVGTHPLGDPAFLLPAWLRHITRTGHTAPAGTVVTTGTWTGMPWAAPGDLVQVVFDGIGQASVQL